MSIIIPANSAVGGGFEVSNSCRFDGSSSKLVKAESAGNRQRWTYSVWLKRSAITTTTTTFFASSDGSNLYSYLGIQSDKIRWLDYDGGNNSNLITSAVFRDPSAWYHIVFAFNSNLGSGETDKAERTKLYINGVRVTSFGTAAYAGHNQDSGVNVNSSNFIIGSNQAQSSASTWNGYMAEAHFIDGTAYQADSFGEFDSDSGVWKPIEVSGLTYGTNGFYLDFKDGDNLGNDANGGTDFTESGLAAIDQTTDTCTNNFVTMNPIDNYYASSVFSNGNLTVVTNSSARTWNNSTIGLTSGKYYCEMKSVGVGAGALIGIIATSPNSTTNRADNNPYAWVYLNGGSLKNNGSTQSGTWASWAASDIIGMALDLDNNKIYFSKNGTWQNTGTANPSTGTDGFAITAVSSLPATQAGCYFIVCSDDSTSNNATFDWNFGSPPFAISSGNADGNGYGNFEYAVPTGYFAICTKNLSEALS